MRGKCSRCKELLTSDNASPTVVRSGYGRCRSCERKHTKVRQRTLGGRFTQGKTQATFNGHKWSLSLQQYIAIVASGECFYCGKPLPTAAGGLDRKENVDYTWDAVLPCCGKQPKAKGPRGCNETKSGEMAPIVLFAIRWHEKYGKLPTEQDFRDRLRKFEAERDRVYGIISSLDSEGLKTLRRATSVRECLTLLRKYPNLAGR